MQLFHILQFKRKCIIQIAQNVNINSYTHTLQLQDTHSDSDSIIHYKEITGTDISDIGHN